MCIFEIYVFQTQMQFFLSGLNQHVEKNIIPMYK